MQQLVLAFMLLAACVPGLVGKGGQGYFNGSFQTQGAHMVLQESGSQVSGTVTASNLNGQIAGTASGYEMRGTVTLANGQAGNFVMYATAEGMEMRIDGMQPIQFRRVGQPPPAASLDEPALPTTSPADAGALAALGRVDTKIPAPSATAATGRAYRDELDGWEVRTPAAWKYALKGNTVAFGSDTEAGMIFVTYNRGLSYEQMAQGASAYIAQLGATQLGETRFRAAGGKGVVVEMSGVVEGTTVHARSLGVAGPGGVLSVTALTTPEKLAGLRKRADAIAMSARFFTPTTPPAMKHLAGPWWHYRGSSTSASSMSYERTLELCADGRFYDSSASDISVTSKSNASGYDGWGNPTSGSTMTAGRNSQDGSSGRWTASGDDLTGRLRLLHNNGNAEEHQYVFKKRGGGDIELDGRWYGYSEKQGGRCR
jgi:hypothetical protein